jgi:hypothetical protein
MRVGRSRAKFAPSPNRRQVQGVFAMSVFRIFKTDTDVMARLLVISAFMIVALVILGLGRPAQAVEMPGAMSCQSCLITSR